MENKNLHSPVDSQALEIKQLKEIIKGHLTDNHTGLPNGTKLLEDFKKGEHTALAVFSVDNFHELNKLYGYEFGGDILRGLTHYFSINMDDNQKKLYKLTGDTFAVLYTGSCNEHNCTNSIVPFLQKLSEKLFAIGELEIYLSMTAGVSFGKDVDILINANIALKNAKENRVALKFYVLDEVEKQSYPINQSMVQSLKYALSNDLIIPYYQPIYNNETLEVESYEVLMRLIEQEGEIISPYFFLDLAHKVNIYPELTKTIIRKAFTMFQNEDVLFSINLSVEDLRNAATKDYILGALKTFNKARNVIFEIVESSDPGDYPIIKEFIQQAKKYGAKIAIDNYGLGYSKFIHLLELEVDFVKIDGSIIKNILTDKKSQVLVQTIVLMANKLNIKVVAEFVSSKEIREAVSLLGVEQSQGFYLGIPKPTLVY